MPTVVREWDDLSPLPELDHQKAFNLMRVWMRRCTEWLEDRKPGKILVKDEATTEKMYALMQEFVSKERYLDEWTTKFLMSEQVPSQSDLQDLRLWIENLKVKMEDLEEESGDYGVLLRNALADVRSALTGVRAPADFRSHVENGSSDIFESLQTTYQQAKEDLELWKQLEERGFVQ